MKERQKHIEAFEYYISIGGQPTDDNIRKIAGKYELSEGSIWRWYKELNWREKAEIRLNEIAKKLAEKSDNDIINIKANYRKEIKQTLALFRATLAKAVKKIDGRVESIIEPEKVKDITDLANSFEKLVKLDLLLLGEDTERIDNTVKFIIDSELDISKFPKQKEDDETSTD